LDSVLLARKLAQNTPARARTERLLARVLEHYGDRRGARRATERAYDASGSDMAQLTATILEASRRALTRGDLEAGRDAMRRALEAAIPDEDLVYVALWLKLLEQRVKRPSDGTVEEAFAAMDAQPGWPGQLRAWGRGRLDDAGLRRAARSRVERTEATFYAAMAKDRGDENDAALTGLRDVAKSVAIELVEVTIARDLLAARTSNLEVSLPNDIDLP
jgi:hypothetical protein